MKRSSPRTCPLQWHLSQVRGLAFCGMKGLVRFEGKLSNADEYTKKLVTEGLGVGV